MIPILHVYAQPSHHFEAHIIGTRDALLSLRQAIDAALQNIHEDACVFASDGEGYSCVVRCVAEQWAPALAPEYSDFPGPWTESEKAAWEAAMDGRAYG